MLRCSNNSPSDAFDAVIESSFAPAKNPVFSVGCRIFTSVFTMVARATEGALSWKAGRRGLG